MKNRRFVPLLVRTWKLFFVLPGLLLFITGMRLQAAPPVVINELHYHPVELPSFNPDGTPFLDLSNDIHEFVEIYNAGSTNVALAGWKLGGEVDFNFPTNAVIG